MSHKISFTTWLISAAIQVPVWITGLWWSIYFIPNLLFGTSYHPGHDIVTKYGGTLVIIMLLYGVALFSYGFMAHSFGWPKPFFKDNEY
ncbi:MAG: hypothetical protein JXA38_01325 [Methanosarcinaceae archaeon]|nr:hypothetical protein [Methanosarcinaceae archaeon]